MNNDAAAADVSAAPVKRRRGRVVRVLMWLAVILVVGFLAFVAFIYVSLEGGLDGFIANRRPAPNPNSRNMVAAREKAVAELDAALASLETGRGWLVAGTGRHDICEKGEHNWKTRDYFEHKCTYRLTRYYSVGGEFTPNLLALEQRLLAQGWADRGMPIGDTTRRNQSAYATATPPAGELPELGLRPGPYKRAPDELEIDYAHGDFKETYLNGQQVSGANSSEFHEVRDLVDEQAITREILAKGRFLVAISVQRQYVYK